MPRRPDPGSLLARRGERPAIWTSWICRGSGTARSGSSSRASTSFRGCRALANVELPLTYAGVRPKQRRAQATAALERVGLGDRLDHLPTELSGGQQQRVAVARAIVTDPSLVLADEPTGNLDTQDSAEVLDVISRHPRRRGTVVLITHDPDIAARANRIVRLRDGQVIEDRRPTA